ncbi:MAG: hypothetical protein ACT4QF_04155 [Sporichthyaceae bacterium]
MTSTTDLPTRSAGPKTLLVRALLGCLAGTAALAIYAVLTASFDETAVRVLLSTLLVGLFCVLCLACLTVLDGRFRGVGAVGMLTATGALGSGLILTWGADDDWDGDALPILIRGFLLCAVVAFACAHAALLLRLNLDRLGGLRATVLACLALVATMLGAAIVSTDVLDAEGYWRLLGVLAILDVLGTVTLPVLARFGRSAR